MLRELSVRNLALIEDARVELQAGYCAWTGETGAGKSLLLTALGLVLGGKAAADLVRAGKDEARAAAVFDLSDDGLRKDVETILGDAIDDDCLILTRRVSASGRSQAHVNSLPVNVSTLRKLGDRLIDVHGQHEGRALLDPDRQRDLLDAFGRLEPLVAAYAERRRVYDDLRRKRAELLEAAHHREREQALFIFERDELAAAEPKAGEHEELTREAHRLANVEELRGAASEGYQLLYEADRSAQEVLELVARRLEPLCEWVPELASITADLGRIADETREHAQALRRIGDRKEDDPDRLEEVEARLALYRRLSTRFRCSPDELAERREQVEAQLSFLERDERELLAIEGPLSDAWSALRKAAEELTAGRRKTCKSFAKAAQAHFKDLSLAEAQLSVDVEALPMGGEVPTETKSTDPVGWVELASPTTSDVPGGGARRARPTLRKLASDTSRVNARVSDHSRVAGAKRSVPRKGGATLPGHAALSPGHTDRASTVTGDSSMMDWPHVPPEGGADRVEIVFAPNPGEAPRPLRKIASGGELSRVTLAIKTVLAEVDRVPTLVFDEIDTGVGGRLGGVLGRKLAELAKHRQVLCVTHLPQMASFAANQWVIRKRSERGRTRTTIAPLIGDDRVVELAAMLRGDSAAEGTRREAIAMLAEARLTP